MKYTYIILLYILCNSCKDSTTETNFFVNTQHITDYDIVFSDKEKPMGMVADIEIVDNMIITQNIRDDHFFSFIDIDKGCLLTKWGTIGQGPGEYVQIGSFRVSNNHLVFLDDAKKEINYVPLSTILMQGSDTVIIKEACPYTADFRPRHLNIVGNKKIVGGYFNEGYFGVLDSNNNIVENSYEFPFVYEGINGIYRGSTFQPKIKSDSKQQKFVISMSCSDIFEIYQVTDTNIVRTYINPFKHIPKIWKKPREYSIYAVDYDNSIAGLLNMAVSEELICFAWSSESYTEATKSDNVSNEILCFGWSGEKVKKYILPFPIDCFCIDKNCIYGVRYSDDDTIIYRFYMK